MDRVSKLCSPTPSRRFVGHRCWVAVAAGLTPMILCHRPAAGAPPREQVGRSGSQGCPPGGHVGRGEPERLVSAAGC